MIAFAVGQWVERLAGIGDSRFGKVVGTLPGDLYRVELYNGACVSDPAHTLRRARPADVTVPSPDEHR